MLRRLTPDDLAAYRALRMRCLRTCPDAFTTAPEEEAVLTDLDLARRLGDRADGAVLGAFDGDDLVGIVGVERETRHRLRHKAAVKSLYVAPEGRGRGVGAALVRAAEAFASERGVERLVLAAYDDNATALALYERLGYASYGVEPDAMRLGERSVARRTMGKRL